jgi:hypothetical protein
MKGVIASDRFEPGAANSDGSHLAVNVMVGAPDGAKVQLTG